MFSQTASQLKRGDVYTDDDGDTWHTVEVVQVTHVVQVWPTEGERRFYNLNDEVVVK